MQQRKVGFGLNHDCDVDAAAAPLMLSMMMISAVSFSMLV